MAKHWRFEDDEFLVSFFDAVGDYIGEHDLGRPKGAATKRVAHLKKTGAWGAIVKMQVEGNRSNIRHLRAELEYAKALGFSVEETGVSDEDAECPADIYDGNYPWRREPFGQAEETAAWSSSDLGLIIQEAVSNHKNAEGVAWQIAACELAKQLGITLIDVRPSTGLPSDPEAVNRRSAA